MKLRQYQVDAVDSVFTYFYEKQGNPLIAMPTGTGKSVVIASFLKRVYQHYPSQRILILTHVKELIEQNYAKLLTLWPNAPAGLYSAGLGRKDTQFPITFAGIGSIAKKTALFRRIDLIIIDEAHLVSPNEETQYQKVISQLKEINPMLKVIGLTATPWRLGHGRITEEGGIFTDFCFNNTTMQSFNELIAQGFLAPLIPRQTRSELDITGVHMRGGEFVEKELQLAIDKDEVTLQALKEAMEAGADRAHWLVFAGGVQHAENVNAMLNWLGVTSVVIHSKMTNDERDERIAGFKSGKYRAAVNNNVLTTGFDFPAIDLIVMLRPTASPVLWVQMLGRGTRPSPNKENCLVLDFAGNTKRLGAINDPVIPRKKGEGKGEAPVKCCVYCNTWNHASVRACCVCGAEFKFVNKLSDVASNKELIKGELPLVEVFKVDHISYQLHHKKDAPDMVKVSYFCGLRTFNEFVCPEHIGYARHKAKQWWALRTDTPMPETTVNALAQVQALPAATHLRVWVNKKYPEIMAHCFNGSGFQTVA